MNKWQKIVTFFIFLLIFPFLVFCEDRRINQLKDIKESPLLRTALAKMLGKEKVKEASPVMIDILKNIKEDCKLRIACANALGEIGAKEAIPVYLEIIKNESEEEDYDVRTACANQLGNLVDKETLPELESLIRTIKDFRGDIINGIVDGISKSKYKKDKDVLAVLGLLITHRKSEIRKKVINILTESNDKSALAFLMIAMEDKSPEVRKIAIQSVGKIGGKSAALAMIDALEDEKKDDIRELIADILNKVEIPPMKKVWIETFEKRVEEEKNPQIKMKLKSALERVKKAQLGK